jgi:colanic acid/amylovoran biosynthesis glycosyltransferase
MNLILLTSEFPFNQGESFIEDEILYLSETFENILIFPITSKNQSKRILPQNIQVINLHFSESRTKKLFTCFFSCSFFEELILNFRKLVSYPSVLNDIVYYYSKSKFIASKIEQEFEKQSWRENETILYSYWLDEKAVALCHLNRSGKFYKVVSRAHGFDLYEERKKNKYQPFRSLLKKKLTEIYFISENGKDYFKNKYGEFIKNQFLICFLGTQQITNFKNDKSKIDKLNFVTISSLNDFKQVHLIPELLSLIDTNKIEWTVFGDGPMYEELVTNINKYIPYIKTNLYRQVPNYELRKKLESGSYHFGIHLSLFEGLPVAFMEMLSVGIPIIAVNSGGVNELINDANGMLLENSMTLNQMAININDFLLRNQSNYETLSRNSIETWDQKFNASINYTNFINSIKS